jgi:hypothetical protein
MKPMLNNSLARLVQAQFWSSKGDALRLNPNDNPYLDPTDSLLALCASAVSFPFYFKSKLSSLMNWFILYVRSIVLSEAFR